MKTTLQQFPGGFVLRNEDHQLSGYREMSDKYTVELARKMAAAKDEIIRTLCAERLGDLPDDDKLIPRLRWEIPMNRLEPKVLLLDDKPLAEFYDVEVDSERVGDTHQIKASFNWRRLP